MYALDAELALLNLIHYAFFTFLIDCPPHLHSAAEVNMHMHLSGKLLLPEELSDLSAGIFSSTHTQILHC